MAPSMMHVMSPFWFPAILHNPLAKSHSCTLPLHSLIALSKGSFGSNYCLFLSICLPHRDLSFQCSVFCSFSKRLSYAFTNFVNLFRSCLASYYAFQALFSLDKKISLSPSCYPEPCITCLAAILSLSTFDGGTVLCKKSRDTSYFFAF